MSEIISPVATVASSANGMNGSAKDPSDENSLAMAFGRNFFSALGGTVSLAEKSTNEETLITRKWDQPSWKGTKADDSADIQQVVCTVQSTIFLTEKGKIYQTGMLHGRLMPQAIPITIPLPLKCAQISAGRHFCLGMMEGGLAVVSWGAGHFGQLGLGGNKKSEDGSLTFCPSPIVIERLLPHVIGSPIKQVACGDWHGLALTQSGRVWAWGSNRSNQCGRKASIKPGNQAPPTIVAPLPVPLDVSVSKIAAGRAHSVAISSDTSQVYCWGASQYGQCGHVLRRSGIAPPILVDGLDELAIIDIAAGSTHTLALTSGGRVFAWGSGSEGQLGIGQTVGPQSKPRLVSDLDFVAIEAGREWKSQQKHQPSGSSKGSSSSLSSVPRIISVHCAGSYSAVISSSGHAYTYGSNDVGQTGLPTPPNMPLKDNYVQPPPKTSSIRDLHVSTFDSRHNVLLPVRLDAASHLYIRNVACGPNHMWCIGKKRTTKENALVVGRTLYEVQEEKRCKNLQRAKEYLLQKVPQDLGDTVSTLEANTSLMESLSFASPLDDTSIVQPEMPSNILGLAGPVPTVASPAPAIATAPLLPSTGETLENAASSSQSKSSAIAPVTAPAVAATTSAKKGSGEKKRRWSLSNLIRRKKSGGKAAGAANGNGSGPSPDSAPITTTSGRKGGKSKRNSV